MRCEAMAYFTTFEEFPDDIAKALKRADAWYHRHDMSHRLHIKSRNLYEPLTDEEKERIKSFLALSMFPYEVIFDN